MAGVLQKAERKAKAVASIEQSASALVEKFSLDVDAPSISKYPEYAELDRLDYVATVLAAILDKTSEKAKPEVKPEPVEQEAPKVQLAYVEKSAPASKAKGGRDDK